MPTTIRFQPELSAGQWSRFASCPPEWAAHITECGGGFFHSPLGLRAGSPAGEAQFFVFAQRGAVQGVAAGIRHSCRLSTHPRHMYFPSPPAVRDPEQREAASAELLRRLRLDGCADVLIDSFDARWRPGLNVGAARPRRVEYVVRLAVPRANLLERCTDSHRRHIRSGDRSGWILRTHGGDDARRVIHTAHETARDRAAARGRGFESEIPDAIGHTGGSLATPWGATVFAAWDGTTLLSAALVGWACRNAYYIVGGSTDAGYARSASTWLQYHVILTLAGAGFGRYNLGGAPASDPAADTEPSGLSRFKLGFGAAETECVSMRTTLRPLHARGHDIRGLLGGWRRA